MDADNEKKFGDEDFIYIKGMEAEKPVHENNIQDGFVIIDGENIPFKRKFLLDKKISVIMPETFTLMTKEIADIKYPSIHRPDLIYTNEEASVDFSLSHEEDEAPNEDIPEIRDVIQEVVMRLYPASSVIDSETITIEASGLNISYYDFIAPALDMDAYTMTFVFSLDGRAVAGGFSCPDDETDTWKPIFLQMLESLEI
jgi:hypothetical protein